MTTKTQFKAEAVEKLSDDTASMQTQKQVLIAGIGELVALDQECGAGAGYEERKLARDDEIKDLNEAIEFFGAFLAQN